MPGAFLDKDEKHLYWSTACRHQIHDRCRRDCKFCEARCECFCHDEEAPDA